jgi:hypothetical protein
VCAIGKLKSDVKKIKHNHSSNKKIKMAFCCRYSIRDEITKEVMNKNRLLHLSIILLFINHPKYFAHNLSVSITFKPDSLVKNNLSGLIL